MAKHLDTLGLCWMIWGGFQLLIALSIGLLFFGLGAMLGGLGASGGDDELALMGGIYAVMGPIIAVFAGIFGAFGVAVGSGIRKRSPWARIGGFVSAVLSIGSVPIGTMLGIFTFVVLLDKDAAAEFEGRVG